MWGLINCKMYTLTHAHLDFKLCTVTTEDDRNLLKHVACSAGIHTFVVFDVNIYITKIISLL